MRSAPRAARARCVRGAIASMQAPRGDFELGDRAHDAVEAPRVLEHGGVAARSHVGEDPAHGPLAPLVLRRLERVSGREPALEARRRASTGARSFMARAAARAKASISGCSSPRACVFSAAWLTIRRARHRHDLLDRDQIVGLQRVAGGHQVDDRVGQPHQRRQLHRAVELDQVDVHALGGEDARARAAGTWSPRAAARPGAPRPRSRSPCAPPPSCGSARCPGRAAGTTPRRRARASTSLPAMPRSAAPYCT